MTKIYDGNRNNEAVKFLASIVLGYTFATLSKDIIQSFAFSRLLSTLFSNLPPIYYPIT
ncbi:MAG: hypothetical protein JRN20_02655 [Nitrososphaerota archaeon]|nr:hypothetical protein [Nitrososphaerota archaeon]MDG6922286.1 hypothetical protein [Nitrososphaerota archaeon]